MAANYSNQIYNQLEEALTIIDKLKQEKKEDKKLINSLTQTVENLTSSIGELKALIEELKAEILRLKTNNNKDSSNSSKPSSTNGYKKTITNTRKKSDNKKGKPKGSKSTNLSGDKLKDFINSGNISYEVKEINKNRKNKNKKPMIFKILDIRVQKVCTELRVYPNDDGTYNIPNGINRPIQYGNNLKAICTFMNNDIYNSTDGISRFINHITNGGINLSKATLLRWNKDLSEKLSLEINKIETELLNSYYINGDDSTIKIDGDNYYDLCTCNDKYTRLYISSRKNSDTWKEKTILKDFKGIIIKDGTSVFNGMGIGLGQCISHIQRYLKGVYDYVSHEAPKKMDAFLQKLIHKRKQLISKEITSFTDDEKKEIYAEYNDIFTIWKKEWVNSKPSENAVYDDERRLLARFEDDEERKEIFLFVEDFNIPATNSRAEVDQRGLKIKQKIGKFRSTDSADDYAIIRSCILTYKKHKLNVMSAIKSAFDGNTIVI